MTARAWEDTRELPEGVTWLLEASAGTGKTYQIAGLVLRLVAEHGVSLERILAITFTTAATAELRCRIRGRLRDALAVLQAPAPSSEDPIVAHLLGLDRRAEMTSRLEVALRSFDLAPISTIHGFSQRMLQEFAFDSGQDPELELLADARCVHEQIVDDSLATLYAEASAEELAVYAEAGVSRAALLVVARDMGGASEPTVHPPRAAELHGALAEVRAFRGKVSAMHARFRSADGEAALAALREDVARKSFDGRSLPTRHLEGYLAKAMSWLSGGASAFAGKDQLGAVARLRCDRLRAAWKSASAAPDQRPWWPFFAAFDAFCGEQEAFWSEVAPLAGFASGVRARIESELERRRALTFDAMLSRLAERVTRDGGADSPIAARIRERFDAAFVDEFQDTDAAQWKVIEAAFHGHRRLFLIGDPKQAIYGFRGADVHVYLEAARAVAEGQRRTMVHNWRSDPQAVQANNHLFRADSGAFDQDQIEYVRVSAKKPDRIEPRGPGLDLRWLDARAVSGEAGQGITRQDSGLVARLAAREAVAWLEGERGELVEGGEGGAVRAFEPADVAVLVHNHHQARSVRLALQRAGVPSVAASKGSVFDSPVAAWLGAWLDAVAGGGRDRAARTAAVTPLFGCTGDELAWALAVVDGGEEARARAMAANVRAFDWDAWTERLRRAAEAWPKRGFARTFDHDATDCGVYPRVLGLPEGERHATDLRHLFELLHVEERSRRGGPGMLADWLRAKAGEDDDSASQRLESDARAVKIETVHVSKGLEYPIVLLPFAWAQRGRSDKPGPLLLRGEDGAVLNVEPPASRAQAFERYRLEERREELRKLYVSLTRARHRTVVWYGPVGMHGQSTSATPLGRLLMRDPSSPGFDDEAMPVFGDKHPGAWDAARARLDALCKSSEGTLAWAPEEPPAPAPARWRAPDAEAPALRVAAWPSERTSIAGPWRVTSYSGLSAGSAAPDGNEKRIVDPPPGLEVSAEPATADAGASAPVSSDERPPLDTSFADLPRLSAGRGTEYGTWVHGVLEHLDFETGAARDGRTAAALLQSLGAPLGFGAGTEHAAELERLLPALLDTPLDAPLDAASGSARLAASLRGLPAGFSLRRLSQKDRLDELTFDLRLGDGTAWRRGEAPAPLRDSLARRPGCVDPRRVYDAILRGDEAAGGPASSWIASQRIRRDSGRALLGSIVGILTGSIDLVFRAADAGAHRYFLADYKTNRLGASSPGHYADAWLEWEMAKAGYPLQALIYTLALHRHLRTRLRGYDYDAHVGGYLYLFLRGMAGPETPRDPRTGRCLGVLGGRWPRQVIETLDEALCPAPEAAP